MELMETTVFIHAQQTAKREGVTPIQATVYAVSQDTRIQYVTRVLLYLFIITFLCRLLFSTLLNNNNFIYKAVVI